LDFASASEKPAGGQDDDSVNPGVIPVNRFLQVAVEAIVPVDAHSGRDLGGRELADDYRFAPGQYLTLRTTMDGECAQAHLYLPAIFPDFYGRPIFGK